MSSGASSAPVEEINRSLPDKLLEAERSSVCWIIALANGEFLRIFIRKGARFAFIELCSGSRRKPRILRKVGDFCAQKLEKWKENLSVFFNVTGLSNSLFLKAA